MKNFSLKALGATILTAGLVFAGVAGPAVAGNYSSLTATPTSSQALGGSTSPNLTLSTNGSPLGFRYLTVGFVNGDGNGLNPNSPCMTNPTWANCGVSGIALDSVPTTEADAPVSIINLGGRNYLKLTWAADVSGQPTVTVDLAAGAFLMGTYNVAASNNFNANLTFFYSNTNGAGAATATGNTLVRTAPPALSPTSVSITGNTSNPTQTSNAFIASGFSSGPTYSTTLTITGYDFSTATGRYTRNSTPVVATSASGTITATGAIGQTATATVSVSITAAPSSTVTFVGNGATSGATAQQTASSQTNLTANGFTKTGYDFDGWSTSQNGPLAYANNAPYPFGMSITLFARWVVSGGGNTPASANMTLNASTGQLVSGSTVAVTASGLQTTAPYTVVVQSTPQAIGSGNATAGAVNTSVTLPAGLEAGWHSLTFTSTGSNGAAVTSVTYFKVSASGTLLATSNTIPAELAYTGTTNPMPLLVGTLSLALIGAELFLIARRKRIN